MGAIRSHAGRTTKWLPWLGVALLVAVALSPGTITASQLAFQSSPAPTPVPPAPTPIPPAPTATIPPPPPPTPAPPAPEPAATQPAEVPPEAAPTEAVPTEEPAPVEPPPAEGQPVQEMAPPTAEPAEPSPALPVVPPPAQTIEPPDTLPAPEAEQPPSVQGSQPIINWVKFWDTMAVVVAYPWLCCGVALLLLVPVALLFLEIKGRRPPPVRPEPLPEERKGGEE